MKKVFKDADMKNVASPILYCDFGQYESYNPAPLFLDPECEKQASKKDILDMYFNDGNIAVEGDPAAPDVYVGGSEPIDMGGYEFETIRYDGVEENDEDAALTFRFETTEGLNTYRFDIGTDDRVRVYGSIFEDREHSNHKGDYDFEAVVVDSEKRFVLGMMTGVGGYEPVPDWYDEDIDQYDQLDKLYPIIEQLATINDPIAIFADFDDGFRHVIGFFAANDEAKSKLFNGLLDRVDGQFVSIYGEYMSPNSELRDVTEYTLFKPLGLVRSPEAVDLIAYVDWGIKHFSSNVSLDAQD